jgi:uncharacterized metal-binding protein
MATKLDLALAQFVGFYHGKWNKYDVVFMVSEMGLTKSEWKKIKAQDIQNYLSESEINEIDEYFQKQR